MNKNLLFLALILSVTVNDAFSANQKRRASDNDDTEKSFHHKKIKDESYHESYFIQQGSEILQLCLTNQFDQAATLIRNTRINTLIDTRGYNILHFALELFRFEKNDAENDDPNLTQTLTFLIEQSANPNHRNHEGQTILHIACQYDWGAQTEAVLDLVLENLNPALVDAVDVYRRHALHYACLNSEAATGYFIKNKIGQAFLTLHDEKGMTPIDLAAASNSPQFDQLINYRRPEDQAVPPLHWAARNNMVGTINQLIAYGFDVNATDQWGITALERAVQNYNGTIVQALVNAAGINVNAKDSDGRTALDSAIFLNQPEIIRILITSPKIDINAQDNDGETHLHRAARDGTPEIVEALINSPKIDINDCSRALEYAIFHEKPEITRILITSPKIDINAQDNDGKTVLHRAAGYFNPEKIQILADAPNININAQDNNGRTALHWAGIYGNTETIRILAARPDINIEAQDNFGYRAIHFALSHRNIETAQSLLDTTNVDVRTASQDNTTTLHIAAHWGHTAFIPALLAGGVNVNAISMAQGYTALHLASNIGHPIFAQALLRAGADTTIQDRQGRTAADVALTPEIRQLILDAQAAREAQAQ